jgi:hypothetical protein
MVASSSTLKCRRGAPLGNQNVRKHVLYASHQPCLADSDAKPLDLDLQAEIDFVRQSTQHVIALGEPKTYREPVDYLRALSLAAGALGLCPPLHQSGSRPLR